MDPAGLAVVAQIGAQALVDLLRLELDRVPLWRQPCCSKAAGRGFLPLPLSAAAQEDGGAAPGIRDGLGLLTWSQDSFAYAESFDEAAGRYRGLRCGQIVTVSEGNLSGLLVRPEVALAQCQTDTIPLTEPPPRGQVSEPLPGGSVGGSEPRRPRRLHGSVTLDPTRVGRDAGRRIADEVIAHLAGLVGAWVKVTLEIGAEIEAGAPENVDRTVTENSRTLKFTAHGFEQE